MKKVAKYLLKILFRTFLCAVAIWAAGLVWYVKQIPWTETGRSEKTEAIVVLTGGRARLDYALELLVADKGKKLLISGVESNVPLEDLFRENVHKRLLPKLKDRFIDIDYVARDTKGNAQETADWMDMQEFNSMRLVTANYHMPRSLFEFRRLMPTIAIIPDPVFPPPFDSSAWMHSPTAIGLIINEYHKYCASRIHDYFL